jgi:phosphatidylglycerophosphate synthase
MKFCIDTRLPSAITLLGLGLGLGLGLVGIALLPSPIGLALLGASLLADVLDGWAARRLNAVTDLGAQLDLGVDYLLGVLLVGRVAGFAGAGAAAVIMAALIVASKRGYTPRLISGRTAITFGVGVWIMWGGEVPTREAPFTAIEVRP